MSFSVSGKIDGLSEALKGLDNCAKRIRKTGIRKSVSEGVKILNKTTKANAPRWVRGNGRFSALSSYAGKQLAKSIGQKIKTYPNGAVVGVVGARKGFREAVAVMTRNSPAGAKYPKAKGDPRYIDPTKYLHLVELGTTKAKAMHFLAQSMEQARLAMQRAMFAAIDEAVAKGGAP